MSGYPAILKPETEGGYSVAFPDCPGCATQGETPGEALAMAREALSGWHEAMRANGHEIAPPTEVTIIAARMRPGEMLALVDLHAPGRGGA